MPSRAASPIPKPEPAGVPAATANAGFATTSAFSASTVASATAGTALTPPVSITYSGSSPTVLVTDTGTNKGIESVITNSSNESSALYGSTNGQGAGLTGYNSGTSGPAGKFYVTNSSSAQEGVFATTDGTGPAVFGYISTPKSPAPALRGENESTAGSGTGVEGNGGYAGVYGNSPGYGVVGAGSVGVYGSSDNVGVWGNSENGTGVYAQLDKGSPQTGAAALDAEDDSPGGAYSYGVYANSPNNIAVLGISQNISAYFSGGTEGNGVCAYRGGSGWECSSDKNLKQDFVPVDSSALLEHLAAMPVFEYAMKGDRTAARYVGPTAQDFMAAFHLGSDDKLINTANAQGVALAAAKELYEKMKHDEEKVNRDESEIGELKQQLQSLTNSFSERMSRLEQQREVGPQTVALRR